MRDKSEGMEGMGLYEQQQEAEGLSGASTKGGNIKLSDRLLAVAAMVTSGGILADVGTDHGYVPICLAAQGKITGAIAMDVNEGPLSRAQAHIEENGMSAPREVAHIAGNGAQVSARDDGEGLPLHARDRVAANSASALIETRLSDGLAALMPGEADSILIAGMGGMLMKRILSDGEQVCRTVKELILQPQSDVAAVREYLRTHGFTIVDEDMVFEDGKYYQMMRALPVPAGDGSDSAAGRNVSAPTPEPSVASTLASEDRADSCDALTLAAADRYGPILLRSNPPVLREYLAHEKTRLTAVLARLSSQPASAHIAERTAEVQRELEIIAAAQGES